MASCADQGEDNLVETYRHCYSQVRVGECRTFPTCSFSCLFFSCLLFSYFALPKAHLPRQTRQSRKRIWLLSVCGEPGRVIIRKIWRNFEWT